MLLLCVVLLLLLLLVAELVLLLLEATEGMIHETSAPATSYTATAGRTLDDLHRQTVGAGAEGLCWRVTGRGRTRKRSHPLDHVRKVHPLGM